MKPLTSFLVLSCWAASFHAACADELGRAQAYSVHLGSMTGIVYFETEGTDQQLVATLSAGPDTTPVRVITTLTAGQSMTVSVPRSLDRTALEVTFVRRGDRLFVTGAETAGAVIR